MYTRDPLYIYDVANPLPPLSEEERARIAGAALFGDPRFAGPDSERRVAKPIDHRQIPAMLFAIEGTAQLVYFSCSVHGFRRQDMGGQPFTVSRMFIVDNHDGTRQTITEIDGIHGDGFEAQHSYCVKTPNLGTLYVPRPDWEGNGTWGTANLTRLALDDFCIVHEPTTGKLLGITRK